MSEEEKDKIIVQPGTEDRAGHRVDVEDVRSPIINSVYQTWCDLKGARDYPAREQISPRSFVKVLRNIILARVIDNEDDFEFRVTGDAHVEVHQLAFTNMRLSEMDSVSPGYGTALMRLYKWVYEKGKPLAMRGWLDRIGPQSRIIFHEAIILPLGPEEGLIDHILVASAYTNTFQYEDT